MKILILSINPRNIKTVKAWVKINEIQVKHTLKLYNKIQFP